MCALKISEFYKIKKHNSFRSLCPMYAVIKAGAHQYVVREGDSLQIDKLNGNEGDVVSFDQVLFVSDGEQSTVFGHPNLEGASVEAVIKKQQRDRKIIVF